jgi:hypothetical protein
MKRYTQMTVGPENVPIFSERNFTITIDDDAAGEYIVLQSQQEALKAGEIKIDADEWDELKQAIDTMIAACKTYE